MYLSSFSKFQCDNCGKTNLVNLGNMNDSYSIDYSHYECWNCKQLESFDSLYDSSIKIIQKGKPSLDLQNTKELIV